MEEVELCPWLHLHKIELEDPRQLPRRLCAARYGRAPDFSLYLEDDLVIQDPLYADKFAWFHQRTDHVLC